MSQLKLTLDTNGLIAVERREPAATDILRLLTFHREGLINLRLVAASASENQAGDRTTLEDFAEFKEWLAGLGFQDHEILMPICVWGVGFWDFCVWGDGYGPEDLLYKRVWSILTAGRAIPTLPVNEPEARRYRNVVCDALMMWSHIYYGGDIFVTMNTRDFNRKSRYVALLSLGAKAIMSPRQAVEAVG